MTVPTPINLVVEDPLSDAVARKILESSKRPFAVGPTYGLTGSGYIRKNISRFNVAAKAIPFLVIIDLDREECPPLLLSEILKISKHPNLLIMIPVKEIEAWLLSHRSAFAEHFRVSENKIPINTEKIDDPKVFLLELIRKSRNKEARLDMLPIKGTSSKQGPNYNGRLISFVESSWNPEQASSSSKSLKRALDRVGEFVST